MLRKWLGRYFRWFHSLRVEGRENILEEGPVLYAANHTSYYDPPLIAIACDKYLLRYMAWDELFRDPTFSEAIRAWGAFPVDPDGENPSGYRLCLKLLKNGERVVVFPEGGRSHGELMPFREGVGRLALQSGAPVVPVRISGAERAWPRSDLLPRPFFPITVEFKAPIWPDRIKEMAAGRKEQAKLLMAMLRHDLGAEDQGEALTTNSSNQVDDREAPPPAPNEAEAEVRPRSETA